MTSRKEFRTPVFVGISLSAVLSGCVTVGPDYQEPDLAGVQSTFRAAGEDVLAPGAIERSDWWSAFDDEIMTQLVADAATGNFDLAEASARIDVALANVSQARRAALPTGGAALSYTRQLTPTATFGGFGGAADAPDGPSPFDSADPINLYSAGLNASWEIDLFGRIRRGVEAAAATLDGLEAARADLLRVVSAETASAYLTLREFDARIGVAEDALESQERVLSLTQELYRYGQSAELDVYLQTTLVEQTRAGVQTLKSSRAETLSALALLTGRTVPDFLAAYPDLAAPRDRAPVAAPSPVITGDPTALLRRRPDVRAAEREVAALTANIGVATADLYPRLTLDGNLSTSALSPGGLAAGNALGYGVGPNLSWGFFNIPAIRANIAAAEAETDAALVAFERTIVSALTETDAALTAYARSVDEAVIRGRALEAAEKAQELSEARYEAGADSLINFLDVQRQTLDAKDAEAAARYNALRRRVDVHRALGG